MSIAYWSFERYSKLYSGSTLIEEQELTEAYETVLFDELQSDKHYDVKIEASYDLLDGNGLQNNHVLFAGTYSTYSNGLPSATLGDVEISSNSVLFNVDVIDEDVVIVPGSLKAIIFKGDERLTDLEYTKSIAGSVSGLEFETLLNDNEYTIKIVADYNLLDGSGIDEGYVIANHTFNTLPRSVPEPQLVNMNILENTIDFGIYIDDPLGIIDQNTIIANLYMDDSSIITTEINDLYFDVYVSNLFANKSFRVELIASYDLNDGVGTHENQVIFDEEFSTLENFKPSVLIENINDTQGYLYVDLQVNDSNETLIGSLWAILYDEDVAVKTLYFDADTTELVFDYVTVAETNYYLEIFADYNLRDGHGADLNQSLSPSVLVPVEPKAPVAEIINVITTTTSISLEIDVIDGDNTIAPNSVMVYLYLGNSLIPADSKVYNPLLNTVLFDVDILSNNEYTIIVEADYDLDDGSDLLLNQEIKSHTVSTEPKELPTFDFDIENITYDSFTFDLLVDDVFGVISPNTLQAVLMMNNAPAVGVDPIDLTGAVIDDELFEDLYSNQGYTVDFLAIYNLNDGTVNIDPVVLFSSEEIETYSYSRPTALEFTISSTINSIIVNVSIEDNDGVITGGLEAVAYLGDIAITSETLTVNPNQTVILVGLESETEYTVKIEANYNLNEAIGAVTDGLLDKKTIATLPLSPPTVDFANPISTTESFTLDIFLDNSALTITDDSYARLYKDGVYDNQEIEIFDGMNYGVEFGTIVGLKSDSDYEVHVFTSYDLNDGATHSVEFLNKFLVKTEAKTVPTITVSNVNISNSQITFVYDLDDTHGVLDSDDITASLHLVEDGFQASKVLSTNTVTFGLSGFLANQDFEIHFSGDYDLNDGSTPSVGELIDVLEFTTASYSAPDAIINSVTINQSNVAVETTIEDIDGMIVGNLRAELYDDTYPVGAPLKTYTDLNLGFNEFNFDEILEYGRIYSVVIVADYNLQDGELIHSAQILDEYVFGVNSKKLPESIITIDSITDSVINFGVELLDDDETLVDTTTYARLYLDGIPVSPTQDIQLNSLVTAGLSFITLQTNSEYEIRIITSYDNDDGNGIRANYVMTNELVTTDALLAPTSEVSFDFTTSGEVQFDVVISNPSSLSIVANAYLYDEDGQYVDEINLPILSNINQTFISLTSQTNYSIIVRITYDLNDGNGELTPDGDSNSFRTLDNVAPTGIISNMVPTTDSVTVTFDLDDIDDIGTTYLNIYDGITLLEGIEITVTGEGLVEVFNDLDPYFEYIIKLETSYDLNDLNGVQNSELDVQDTVTLTMVEIDFLNEDLGSDSNILEVTINDMDDILVDATNIVASITQYDTDTFDSYMISPDGFTTLELVNLLSENTYVLEFTATYDKDGSDVTRVIYSYTFETEAREMPIVTIEPSSLWVSTTGPDTLTVNIEIGIDANGYATDTSWVAYVYIDGNASAAATVALTTPEGSGSLPVIFNGVSLDNAGSYTVVVKAFIDINVYDSTDPLSGFLQTTVSQSTIVNAEN